MLARISKSSKAAIAPASQRSFAKSLVSHNESTIRSNGLGQQNRTLSTATAKSASSPTHQKTQTRTMATSSLSEFGQKYVNKGLGRLTEAVITKGQGSYIDLDDGRHMLDFTSGIGVTNLGHCHPKVSKAAADQCMNLVHGQCSIAFHGPYLELIEKLLPVMPDPSLNSFYWWNSGSEAVEGAVKIARLATGRQNIITMQGAYHGRTFGAMALTRSKTIYSEGCHPLMPGVFTVAFPYWHHHNLPPSTPEAELVKRSLYQLDLLLAQQTTPNDVAAIIIETVIGEGGYIPAPPSFLKGLRDVCDKNGILLIIDEVQSGFGRTGKYFAIEYSGVRPDIMTVAKGLANGFPLSGVIARRELTDTLKAGSMGGTYAGNAVACAAGVACAEVMKEEKILENVQVRSKELFGFLNDLQKNTVVGSNILEVRGQGLMVAVEFASPTGSAHDPMIKPDAPANLAKRVSKRCQEKGLFILTTSIYEVIRFIPALNITKEDLAKGCKIFADAVEEVVKEG
ncbi:hypothetical protein JAAARDRAFT_35178 [Jaapia argillacea MUCL 33604]|uniref:4-aminobutyrate aminotransferase n=1 Tax=Jaapia argillacea MUCL 33604 TaxID=933084 RepID=A0A067Q4G3_9AGAM|nr:hypothetical protein JAAARDRAFT_35178 [Jaapia argillacea MUCL 33604]